ncbi:MAG: extracellular solute-binding protein [Hyphomicrobiales bacterium]
MLRRHAGDGGGCRVLSRNPARQGTAALQDLLFEGQIDRNAGRANDRDEAGFRRPRTALLLGLMPIIPKHYWKDRKFDATSLDPFIGSGPYTFGEIKPGESIVYRKNPDYWGKNLPFNRGLWNFDGIRIDYFRDSNAAFEAFKKGLADFRVEVDPVRWSSGYDFPAAKSGEVVRESIAQKTPAPTSGLAFNTRHPVFADPRVREALIAAFDFEWANANLFSSLYQRTYGYYSGSELSSRGVAADARELALLGEAAKKIPPAMLDGTYQLPQTDGSGRDRKSLRKVVDLLKEAGYEIKNQSLVNVKTGEPVTFTISVASKEQEKIALHYQRTLRQIGIDARVRLVDAAQFSRVLQEYDFDMAPVSWYNSLSPGNEQSFYYGSGAAKTPGTRNYPGIADPDVDRMIDALTEAKTREDLVTAVHALDRLLVAGFYIVPLYDAGGQWVARWKAVEHPEEQPCPASKPAPCGASSNGLVMNKPWLPEDCAKTIADVEAALRGWNDLDAIESNLLVLVDRHEAHLDRESIGLNAGTNV